VVVTAIAQGKATHPEHQIITCFGRLPTNGKPFWTMTPDEIARERTQK